MTTEPGAEAGREWYYAVGTERRGPATLDEMRSLATAAAIDGQTLVWRDGMDRWAPAHTTELASQLQLVPAPLRYVEGQTNLAARDRWLAETPAGEPQTFTRLYWWWMVSFGVGIAAYVATFWTFLLSILGAAFRGVAPPDPPASFVVQLVVGMTVVGIVSLVCLVLWITLTHRNWMQVNDGAAPTTPGMAVGLSCIPCFNLYWIFIAVRGLALEMNRVMDEHRIPGPRPNTGLALAYCIANVCTIVPLVNYVAWLAVVVLGAIVYYQLQRSGRLIFEWRVARARAAQPATGASTVG